jgi:O-antigen/teichoic acid export membrane protein
LSQPPAEEAEPNRNQKKRPRSIIQNFGSLLASQGATWVLSSALLVLLPRMLGPVALGDLRLAASVWLVVGVFSDWGTSQVTALEVAKDRSQAHPMIRSSLKLRFLLFALTLPAVGTFLFVAGYPPIVNVIVAISAVTAAFTIPVTVIRAALIGLEEMPSIGRFDVATETYLVIATIVVLVLGGGVIGITILGTTASALGYVWLRHVIRRHDGPDNVAPRLQGRPLFRRGSSYLVLGVSVTLYLQVDTIIISLLVGEKELGWYSTADSIFGSLFFVPTILMTTLFPRFARMHDDDTSDQAPALLEQAFRTLLLCGTWIGVSTVVVSQSFTTFVFDQRFAGAGPVLAVFGVVTILGYQTILLGTYAATTDRARVWSVLMFVSILASVPLDLVLVHWTSNRFQNGAIGGALAYIVTELVQVVAGILWLAPHLISRTSLSRVVRMSISAGATFAAGWPLRRSFFVIPGLAGSAAFFASVALLGTLDEFERATIRRIINGTRRLRRSSQVS